MVESQRQRCHYLRGFRNDKLAYPVPCFISEPDLTKCSITDTQGPRPHDAGRVESKRISLKQMIVEKRREEVMACRYCMCITGQMEIDIFHRNHLGMSSAGPSAFDAKHRTERRLSQGHSGPMPQSREPHGKPYRGGGLSLPKRRWIDSCHKHIAAHRPVFGTIQ